MHDSVAHSTVSDALVRFATGPFADQVAQTGAKRAVSQARANAAAAAGTGRQVAALLQSQGSTANDTRVRAWVLGATLATHAPSSTSTPVLAAVIALGEKLVASDDEIAAAAAIGIEAAARLLAAVDSGEFQSRWNVSSAVGILGAALAISRLLKLDETRTRHALGIAATQAAGLARNAGESMAAIEIGKAAADAVEASLLAKHGFTSAPASIDGRRGFAALMAYRFDASLITEGLGTHWMSLQ
jgi:2-methylcitrate dehydratase PrpD